MTTIQAIDLLKGLEQSLDDYCELNDEGKTAFRMGIIALELFGNAEQLSSVQPEQKWIPCSERLPEEDGQYLITVKYEHVDDYEDIYSEHGEWADGKWDMFTFGHCGKVENIIAWMPLPEPYREGIE